MVGQLLLKTHLLDSRANLCNVGVNKVNSLPEVINKQINVKKTRHCCSTFAFFGWKIRDLRLFSCLGGSIVAETEVLSTDVEDHLAEPGGKLVNIGAVLWLEPVQCGEIPHICSTSFK